jgi:polygalacturonase
MPASITKCNIYKVICLLLFFLNVIINTTPSIAQAKVVVYPAPKTEKLSINYLVSVAGKNVPVYVAKVAVKDKAVRFETINHPRTAGNFFSNAAFAYFDLKGEALVTITTPQKIVTAKVLPSSAGITSSINNHSISFKVSKAQNITIEINGDIIQSLHLFVNPIDMNIPLRSDPNVIFFGPGIHNINRLIVGSNQTVYIAGGAILKAGLGQLEPFVVNQKDSLKHYRSPSIELQGANITIRGRGIIDASLCTTHSRNLLMVRGGSNVKIEGIILRDAPEWNLPIRESDHVVIDNIKILGYRSNSDGIDICNSKDIEVKNSFVRTNDDLIVVKTDQNLGPSERITVQNCILWNSLAHSLSIGAEIREPINDVLFSDCDVIHDKGREWTMRIYQTDSALVSNIRFQNIRVEESNQLISLWIGKAMWSHDKDYGNIQNVIFKNITASGACKIELVGQDNTHLVQNVTFQDVIIDSKRLSNSNIKANSFAKSVNIVP